MFIKLKVMSFFLTSSICLIVIFATSVEGYASWCDVNQTVFVPEGSTARFKALRTETHPFFNTLRLRTTMPKHDVYLFGFRIHDDSVSDTRFNERSWENRTEINVDPVTNNKLDIRIDISHISMKDNGTYLLRTSENLCWILFVMQIQSQPIGAIEETKPLYIYAHPHASLIKRPIANATMVWLLDGLSVNQTANFIQQDGYIWIPNVHRALDGRNATYQAIQDKGDINEVSYTLDVIYGPSNPLTLVPGRTQYYLVSGDVMPNVTCTTDCKPPCSISWGRYSNGNTLQLGTVTTSDTGDYTCVASRTGAKSVEQTVSIYVADEPSWIIKLIPEHAMYIVSVGEHIPEIACTANCNPPCHLSWGTSSSNGTLRLGTVSKDMNGEYICTATRQGSQRREEKRVTVHVQDNASFVIAVACLATVQALTTFGLGLCAFFVYRRNKQSSCQTNCSHSAARDSSDTKTSDGSTPRGESAGREHYEDVGADTGHINKAYEMSSVS